MPSRPSRRRTPVLLPLLKVRPDGLDLLLEMQELLLVILEDLEATLAPINHASTGQPPSHSGKTTNSNWGEPTFFAFSSVSSSICSSPPAAGLLTSCVNLSAYPLTTISLLQSSSSLAPSAGS